jgi:hypothetical protein
MKKLLLLLSILITLNTYAQTTEEYPRYSIGVNGGITLASLDKNLKQNFDAKAGMGYSAGIVFNFALHKYISLEIRPSAATINYKTEYIETDIVSGLPIGTMKTTTTHTQGFLPLLADFHNGNAIKGHIYAGGFYSQLISAKTTYNSQFYNSSSTVDNTESYYDDNTASGGGLIFGAGVGFHPKQKGVAIVLQYLYYKHLDETWLEDNNIGVNLLYSF